MVGELWLYRFAVVCLVHIKGEMNGGVDWDLQ